MSFSTAELERTVAMLVAPRAEDLTPLGREELLAVRDLGVRLKRIAEVTLATVGGEVASRSVPARGDDNFAKKEGFASPTRLMADALGSSLGEAGALVDAGTAMRPVAPTSAGEPAAPRFPILADATRAGELSVQAAAMVTRSLERIADVVPLEDLRTLEGRVVAKAATLALHELRRLLWHVEAEAQPRSLEERERRQRAERSFGWRDEPDGMVSFSGRLDPASAAPLRAAIEGMVTAAMHRRRDAGPDGADQRSVWQMRADALVELARHFGGCTDAPTGVRTTVVVRVALADLQSGLGIGSIDGMAQPISVEAVRRMAADAEVIPMVLGGRGEVLDLGRAVRLFSQPQRMVMLERDGGCAWCLAPPAHCEAHHINWWRNGGKTDISNGVMLCSSCHHRIHDQGWTVRVRDDRVWFIPPESIDPERTPRPGGRARVELEAAEAA